MSRSIRYPNHAPRPWPQARPEPTAHIEAEFAHGTGSWPAPTFRFGLAHACGRTTRLRQHASRAGVAATATHPSATTSASSARAGVMATSFANGFSGRFGSVTRRQPSLPFPTSPPVLQPGADPQQDAPGDHSEQAPEGECQQAPADECQKAQDVRPSQLHCRTCRLISSYRLGAHYTLRPVTRARFLEAWDLQLDVRRDPQPLRQPADNWLRRKVARVNAARHRGAKRCGSTPAAAPARLAAKPRAPIRRSSSTARQPVPRRTQPMHHEAKCHRPDARPRLPRAATRAARGKGSKT